MGDIAAEAGSGFPCDATQGSRKKDVIADDMDSKMRAAVCYRCMLSWWYSSVILSATDRNGAVQTIPMLPMLCLLNVLQWGLSGGGASCVSKRRDQHCDAPDPRHPCKASDAKPDWVLGLTRALDQIST